MNCDEARLMMHALIDGELDAGHARDIEAHLAACQRCAAELGQMRELRQLLSGASLGLKAPASLRRRIDAAIPAPEVRRPSRRLMLQCFSWSDRIRISRFWATWCRRICARCRPII
jgi:mycothiol system anti-sigma-R factor